MQATVSVIIPAFNAGRTLKKTLDQVQAQSVQSDEVIVVDDGSSDDTLDIAYTSPVNPIVLTQPNSGAAAARQAGSQQATGEYLAYLDADDWWPASTIARYRQIVSQHNISWLLADLDRASPHGVSTLPRNSTFYPWMWDWFTKDHRSDAQNPLFSLSADDAFRCLLRGFPVFPSAMLVRKSALEQVGGWDSRFKRCQDFDLGLRLTKQFNGDLLVLREHLHVEQNPLNRALLDDAYTRKRLSLARVYRQSAQYQEAVQHYRYVLSKSGYRHKALPGWLVSKLRAMMI